MIAWLSANLYTIVVALIVFAVLGLIVRGMVKDKKQGKSSCGGCSGDCAHCHQTHAHGKT